MNLDELLGIDAEDAMQARASRQVDNDWALLDDLIASRKRAGLSQRAVAEGMGVDKSVVARLESRTRDPHLSTLRRYALAVGAEIRHDVVVHSDESPCELAWPAETIAVAINKVSDKRHQRVGNRHDDRRHDYGTIYALVKPAHA